MKFISNIGWIHKSPTELSIDILNVEDLEVSIPLVSIRAIIDSSSEYEPAFDKRGDVIGVIYLSPKKTALYLDIDRDGEKTGYSTQVKFIERLLADTSTREPISQRIEDRDSTNNMPSHDYYLPLCEHLSVSVTDRECQGLLEAHQDAVVRLISHYREGKAHSIDYEDPNIQAAYMLCYFPLYIENIFQTLSFVDTEHLRDVFKGRLKVSLYGCGPAPDFLGLLAYINKYFKGELSTIEPYFFDSHNWRDWREFCLEKLVKNYCDGITIVPHHCPFNLLECDKEEYLESFHPILDSRIHIFQNCATELLQATGNVDTVVKIFLNYTNLMKSGSIILINDVIGNGDSFKILLKYEKKLLEMDDMVFLDQDYNVDEYAPNLKRYPVVASAIDKWYDAAEKKTRKRVGFSYCVAKKC